VQAKRDTESSNFGSFWIPAFAGMTLLKPFSPIATQSLNAQNPCIELRCQQKERFDLETK
jgi:hypothetical protein